jgi:hypothetical protein
MTVYNTQKYWGSGICQLSAILRTRKQILETGSLSVLREWEEDIYSVGSLRKS